MIFVFRWPAVETKGIAVTIQAIHIAFTPGGVAVGPADGEERRVKKFLQPRRHRHCILQQPNNHQNSTFLGILEREGQQCREIN